MLTKLGNTLFVIFVFCCNFLMVQIIINIAKQVKALQKKIAKTGIIINKESNQIKKLSRQ